MYITCRWISYRLQSKRFEWDLSSNDQNNPAWLRGKANFLIFARQSWEKIKNEAAKIYDK